MANIIKTTPSKKNKKKSSSAKRNTRIAVLVIALLLVLGGIAWGVTAYINSQNSQRANEQSEADKRLAALQDGSEKASQVYDRVDSLIESGDTQGVGAAYDKAIDDGRSDIEKASLYFSKATSLHSMGDLDGALEAAIQADRLDTNKQLVSRTESLIANTAYDLGRWEVALRYYQRQYDRIKDEPVDMGDPLPGLEERISELRGRIGDE